MSENPEITVRLPVPSLSDLQNNRNVVMAALQAKREVRIRVNIDLYGPGTQDNPKARYYAMMGSSPTITCRTSAAVEHALDRIREVVVELNGWIEVSDAV